jgi:hypothetical protein
VSGRDPRDPHGFEWGKPPLTRLDGWLVFLILLLFVVLATCFPEVPR